MPHVLQESPAGPTQCDATAKAPHNDFKEDSKLEFFFARLEVVDWRPLCCC